MMLFGSRGLPDSIRRVPGFGVHTFKMVTADGRFRYCKFHFRPVDHITNFSKEEATRMAGVNSDFHNEDLWCAISRGHFPVWKLYVQVMEPEQAETYGRGLFDITKVWSQKEFPLIEVGKMTLNKNVREPYDTIFGLSLTTLSSLRTTSLRSNKRHSHLRIWCLALP